MCVRDEKQTYVQHEYILYPLRVWIESAICRVICEDDVDCKPSVVQFQLAKKDFLASKISLRKELVQSRIPFPSKLNFWTIFAICLINVHRNK